METELVTVTVTDDRGWVEFNDVMPGFDELYVIIGNGDYISYDKASWYKKAHELYIDICYDVDNDWEYDSHYIKCSKDVYDKILVKIRDEELSDSNEGMVFILNLLYPEWKFDLGTIRGYTQSEWQEVIYRSDIVKDLEEVEAFYFGKFFTIFEDFNGTLAFIPHNEFWRAEMEPGGVENLIRERLEIDDRFSTEIYKRKYDSDELVLVS